MKIIVTKKCRKVLLHSSRKTNTLGNHKPVGGYSRARSTLEYPVPRYTVLKVDFRSIVPIAAIWYFRPIL